MLDYVFGHDEIVANFVASLIPECRARGFGKCRAMGVVNSEGDLIGGVTNSLAVKPFRKTTVSLTGLPTKHQTRTQANA